MGGFMNAELKNIRDNLVCGHCQSVFQGTDSQARKVKYENRITYCSLACRAAARSAAKAAKALLDGSAPLFGPCPVCNQMFESRTSKIFCNMACYVKSKQFKALQQENIKKAATCSREELNAAQRKGQEVPCLECGKVFYQKRATNTAPAKKFCCRPCYRSYLAKRFDRHIANPERLALPQNYDEFLDRDELPCLVEGCDWRGQHLSIHMNQAHGITADELKRAAGFNLGSGIISRVLAKTLSERENVGIGLAEMSRRLAPLAAARRAQANTKHRYMSKERKEHAMKTQANIRAEQTGPERICRQCQQPFEQSSPFGKTLYCSTECRSLYYYRQKHPVKMVQTRAADGTFVWVPAEDRNSK